MARAREMQGVPAHIEVLKSNDGIRRHPSHCIYSVGKRTNRICDCPDSPKWRVHCSSSKNCDFYQDNRLESMFF